MKCFGFFSCLCFGIWCASTCQAQSSCESIFDISTCTSPCIITCNSGLISRAAYGDNEYNEVIVNIPNYITTLEMLSLDTEYNYDFISVFECTSSTLCVNLLRKYSGQIDIIPRIAQSTTGVMKIVWNSDTSFHAGGWQFKYSLRSPVIAGTPCIYNMGMSSACTEAVPCIITCTSGIISRGVYGNNENMHVIVNIGGNVAINFDFQIKFRH